MTEWNVWKNKFGKMYQTMEEEIERLDLKLVD